MKSFELRLFRAAGLLLLLAASQPTNLPAQSFGEWPTAGANPQRTSNSAASVSTVTGVAWYRPIEAFISGSTQLITSGSNVYVATAKGLIVLNAESGNIVCRFDTELPVNTPTVDGGAVYVPGFDRKLHSLNASTCAVNWTFTSAGAGFSGNPIVTGGRVYIGNRDGRFYAINTSNGSQAWSYTTAGPIMQSAAYDNGVVYFASMDMYGYALNTSSGSLVWRTPQKLPGEQYTTWWPVIHGNYVVWSGATAYKFESSPGANDAGGVDFNAFFGVPASTADAGSFISSSDGSHGWAAGSAVMSTTVSGGATNTLQGWANSFPARRVYAIVNKSNGVEPFYLPMLEAGQNTNGQMHPPVSDGTSLYFNGPYQRAGSNIPRSRAMAWKEGTSWLRMAGATTFAADEPLILSMASGRVFANLCCDREARTLEPIGSNFWSYGGNMLNFVLPSQGDPNPYDPMWAFYDGEDFLQRLGGYYKGNISSRNGVYHNHGMQNPLVPHAFTNASSQRVERIFTHRSNAVIALGPTASKTPQPLVTANTNPSNTGGTLSSAELQSRLETEVQKMVSLYLANGTNGFLKPAYISDGGRASQTAMPEDSIYFRLPADTLYSLSTAYPYLSSGLQANLLSYLNAYWQKYFVASRILSIGWNSGTPREAMEYPSEVANRMSQIGDSTNGTPAGTWQRSFYAAWKYAQLVPSQTASIYSTMRPMLIYPPQADLDIVRNPAMYNDYIVGYQGFLNLYDLAGTNPDPTLRTNVANQLTSLLSTRLTNFAKDHPWQGDVDNPGGLSVNNYSRRFNCTRNFLYMTPELGASMRGSVQFGTISQALNEYLYVCPHWFMTRDHNSFQEASAHHIFDSHALFLAKAYVAGETQSNLSKWIDVPWMLGDLYHIQNLTAALQASGTPPPPPPPPNPDVTPPVISGISATNVASTSATINWTTNEASDTQVEYGLTTSYGQTTGINAALVTSHSATLSNLTPGTLYHYRVRSRDAASNLGMSQDNTFTTTAGSDTQAPVLSAITAGSITSSGATISWTTNEASDTQVEYGLTTSYGQTTSLNSSMVTSHTASVSNLTASSLYHYRVRSRDAAANLATSSDNVFTTSNSPNPGALQISSITDNRSGYANSQVPKYEKLEITFDVSGSAATNLQMPYDPNPPAGIPANWGISVSAEFTQDNFQTVLKLPAFYYQDFDYQVQGGRDWLSPRDQYSWRVRFAPPATGTWQYRITATDASGTATSSIQQFTVAASTNKGFVRVSTRDTRYFEFEDGSFFSGLGYNNGSIDWFSPSPIASTQPKFQTMSQNGVQLTRTWLSQSAIFGSAWNPWYGMRGDYGGYVPRTGLTPAGTPATVKLRLSYAEDASGNRNTGYFEACRVMGGFQASTAVKRNTNYRFRVRFRAFDVTGPRNAAFSNYGFVLKLQNPANGNWHSNCYDAGSGNSTGLVISPYSGDTADYTFLEGDWGSGSNDFLPMFYLALENVSALNPATSRAPSVYVESVEIREKLADGTLTGPNLVSKPSMEHHRYFEQRNSYVFDRVVEMAKQNDVYLKPVILEKDEDILSWIDSSGNLVAASADNFYGNYRTVTAGRWLQQAWWRYLQARWGYSTSIHSWELVNEGNPSSDRHYVLADELGKYMRQFAPNHHLVTTSFWHSLPSTGFWKNSSYPNLDYADLHAYVSTSQTSEFNITSAKDAVVRSRCGTDNTCFKNGMKDDAALNHSEHSLQARDRSLGKPLMRAETGLDFPAEQTEDPNLVRDVNGVWLHNFIWSYLNSGGMYDHYWWTTNLTRRPGPDGNSANGLHEVFKPFRDFVANIPLNSGSYQDLAATVSNASGVRVLGQKDLTNRRTHGWVQNRKHTWCAVVGGVSTCPDTWDNSRLSGTVTIPGFAANSQHAIEWWQFDNAGTLTRPAATTITADGGGNIVLNLDALPSTVVDAAVKIGTYTDGTPPPPPNDTTPPVLSGISATGISGSGATITWTTNEVSDTQVEYGATTSYGQTTTLNTSLVTSHSTTLANLSISTLYHYRVRSRDAAGNLALSPDYTFTTNTSSDTTPPTISAVAAGGISGSGATVTWTTNEASDTQLEYGLTMNYGQTTTLNTARVTAHNAILSNLFTGTLYHYRVRSRDAAGNLALSVNYTFTTLDTTPPSISGVAAGSITNSSAVITWNTGEAADTQVEYGVTTGYGQTTTLNPSMVTIHSATLAGLSGGTMYHYRVRSKDADGNLAVSPDDTFITSPAATAPAIASLSPDRGDTGTVVVISGRGFGGSRGASSVAVSGVAAAVSGWSDTSITMTIPASAIAGPVVVTVNGLSSNEVNFRVGFKLPPPRRPRIRY